MSSRQDVADKLKAVLAELARSRPETEQMVYSATQVLEQVSLDGVVLPTLDAVTDSDGPPPEPDSSPFNRRALGRYVIERELGRGGMGRVLEAYDPELRRRVAIKVILEGRGTSSAQLARFVSEAQITSQLEHPSVVPVHDFGITREGTLFYVMKRVSGYALSEILALLREAPHAALEWSRHRLLGVFGQVCQAVAYAHSRSVLHRDLKPENIMVGDFGEVLVLDWGVARVMVEGHEEELEGSVDRLPRVQTLDGAVIGTPGYMSPEQIRGEIASLDGGSDLWSLGSILYEILTLTPAFEASSTLELLAASLQAPRDPRHLSPREPIPEELAELCLKALAPDRGARFASVTELARALQEHLEGSRRRKRGRAIVARGRALEEEAAELLHRARALRDQARDMLEAIPRWESEERKLPAWELEDEAKALQEEAERKVLEFRHHMHIALNHAPELSEPHRHMAAHFRKLHEEAEAARDARAKRTAETLLRMHGRGEHAAYLSGRGALTLVTDPAGAEVELFEYQVHHRRWVPRSRGVIGHTPLLRVPLEMGSYLLKLRAPGRAVVHYPVHIGRGEHWDGIPPEGDAPHPVWLPRVEDLTDDLCYIPAGGFWAGDDNAISESYPRHRTWCHGFFIQRFTVTNRAYLDFLNALVLAGREDEAMQCCPREREPGLEKDGAPIYGRDDQGRFVLRPDADGDMWYPDYPALLVDWSSACAFADAVSETRGETWRLPYELEWEKAARGVDGRSYPWGEHWDPSWYSMRESHRGRWLPSPVGSFPIDASPYGVRGMAGNAGNLTANLDTVMRPSARVQQPDPQRDAPPDTYRMGRGGSFKDGSAFGRCSTRYRTLQSNRNEDISFRLVRMLP